MSVEYVRIPEDQDVDASAGTGAPAPREVRGYFEAFKVPAPEGGGDSYHPSYATLDLPDLRERFELLRKSLETLNGRMAERRELVSHFKQRLSASLRYLAFDFQEHWRTWWLVERDPSAAARRSFLQQELLHLQDRLYQIDLDEVDRVLELERERDRLVLEYVQLRRVAQAIDG